MKRTIIGGVLIFAAVLLLEIFWAKAEVAVSLGLALLFAFVFVVYDFSFQEIAKEKKPIPAYKGRRLLGWVGVLVVVVAAVSYLYANDFDLSTISDADNARRFVGIIALLLIVFFELLVPVRRKE
ncbi:hypothetical protein [uncultured Alistipes sp.]|jgi:hypothetical protein|uniref:hypothetical protein n=1 Tax=uncultured Alistipes sp. TaxID=538949 RepID=UPI0025DF9008|nr:hypothetical protein [uncultured Alistipes sp.]